MTMRIERSRTVLLLCNTDGDVRDLEFKHMLLLQRGWSVSLFFFISPTCRIFSMKEMKEYARFLHNHTWNISKI